MPAAPSPALAATFKLDRRVTIETQSEAEQTQLRASELAGRNCCVVLLAEPGMGKSTVLDQTAIAAGTTPMQVRMFLNEEAGAVDPSAPLFLDGLDEYRTDGSAADKLDRLAGRLRQIGSPLWWLACRAEDWTRRDLGALKGAAGGREIVVARLAPLDIQESWGVLSALGDSDPNALVARAKSLGGAAFLQNPLSLKLLLRSVKATGEIPQSRHALYEGATRDLAGEHNEQYDGTERASLDRVISTARRICALLLVTNQTAVWRSTLATSQVGGYLSADDLGLPSDLLADTLNTALFTSGDSGKFEPMHRTVAEFLAGRAMADAVVGGPGRPRFPLGRALALITGSDGPTPAPLRGVYGWMAVHLSMLGQDYAAEQMCRRDASTVLIYGDVRVLTTPVRKTLLASLDRSDPWFRDIGDAEPAIVDAAIGGLVGEDIAEDLERVLRQRNDPTDLFVTVTDAIEHGDKVPRVLPVLWEIVMDQSRRHFERVRSAGAWILASPDPRDSATELFRAVRSLPRSESNVALSVSVANRFPDSLYLEDAELIELLADHVALSAANSLGRLVKLSIHLQAFPRPTLMLPSVNEAFPKTGNAAVREVWALLDKNAVGLLRSASPPSPGEVWEWLKARDRTVWEPSDVDLRKALQFWIGESGREAGFFLAIQRSEASWGNDWFPGRVFAAKVGRYPSAAMVTALLAPANGPFQSVELVHRIGLATALAVPADCVAEVRAGIAMLPDAERRRGEGQLAERLAEAVALRTKAQESDDVPARYISMIRAQLSAPLPNGDSTEGKAMLDLAAQYHFRVLADDSCAESKLPLAEFLDADVAGNIVAAWQTCARAAGSNSPADIARTGCSQAILAGIESLVAREANLPLGAALLVLCGQSLPHRAEGARLELLAWAWRSLGTGGSQGAQALVEFWEIEAQYRGRCSGLPDEGPSLAQTDVLSEALERLLWRGACLSDPLLSKVLGVAADVVPLSAMRQVVRYWLARELPRSERQAMWLIVAFAVEPEVYLNGFQQTMASPNAPGLETVYSMITKFARRLTPPMQALVAATVFRLAAADKEDVVSVGGFLSDPAAGSLERLRTLQDPAARHQLLELEQDPRFVRLKQRIRNTLARQARFWIDRSFVAATPLQVMEALAGGRPVNASDLRAVVVDELGRIQSEMQHDPLMPWQLFWSDEKTNRADDDTDVEVASSYPKIENKCRNVIGLLLQARLGHYGIAHRPVPEAQRAAETRVDLTCESIDGAALPIEMKRHYHKDVWIAAAGQLQGYTADHAAGGFGIYVVFWFGAAYRLPAHPSRNPKPAPKSAGELQALLQEDLPEHLRHTTDIIVLDVSDPRAAKRAEESRTPRAIRSTPAKKVPTKKSRRAPPSAS